MTGTDLSGLRVAITGGTSGLGLALVRELRDRGAHVAFVARNRDEVERVVNEAPGARGIVGDVSRKEDIHPIAIQVLGALGGLDVLVNNASSLGPVPLVPSRTRNARISSWRSRRICSVRSDLQKRCLDRLRPRHGQGDIHR